MEDLVFTTPRVYCPDCRHLIDTSIEELADNDEIACPQCGFVFTPNIEIDKFLKLIKEVENKL